MDYLISSSQEDYEEDVVIMLILQLEKGICPGSLS